MTATADPLAPTLRGAVLRCSGLGKSYRTPHGPVVALHDVDLHVPAGGNLAIVGPSGSGKSTLLGLIGGLELPTAGSVQLGETTVSALTAAARARLRRRRIGFVFQADNLAPFLTVAENVGLQAVLSGAREDADWIRELLEALGVADLAARFPDQLSGGQRQRVAVARALVHRPDLVLADEPTGALDAVAAGKVVDLLLRMHQLAGATLVVVTHDRAVAQRLDAALELRAGTVVTQ